MLATNLDRVFLVCKHAIRTMRQQGTGSIINISSRSRLVGIPGAAAYAASKAAVRNHTRTVALYFAEKGWKIRCNPIHPAAILTPMWEPVLGRGEDRERRMEAIATGAELTLDAASSQAPPLRQPLLNNSPIPAYTRIHEERAFLCASLRSSSRMSVCPAGRH